MDQLERQQVRFGGEAAGEVGRTAQRERPARAEGERKIVTIMFADLSGFTALSETSDPERVRDLLNGCFDRLVPVVERYGGTIDKFIGDAIMALFGAPIAHENDAERALRAALDMLAELERFNAEQGSTLGIHFGINTGEVIAGQIGSHGRRDYSVIGDPVNVAARLESLSQRGEIFVGPETHRLTRNLFEFAALDPILVKGREAPVPIYRLLGLASSSAAAGADLLALPIVGREAELARLLGHVDALRRGESRTVLVSAAAGIGKSRLIAEARARTEARARWLEGRAHSFSQSASYGVVLDLLFRLAELPPDADVEQMSRQLLAACACYAPGRREETYAHLATVMGLASDELVRRHTQSVSGELLKRRIAEAFVRLARGWAAPKLPVLCFEDAHWFDPASTELIEMIAGGVEGEPLLTILTSRPASETGEGASRVGARLDDHIELQPLGRDAAELMMHNFLGCDGLPDATRALLLDRADGNPFYLEELLRSLVEAGVIVVEDGSAHASGPIDLSHIPATLRGIVMARLDRLPAECKRTLQTASVLGRVFQLRLLAKLNESGQQFDAGDLTGQLALLEQREFVDGQEQGQLVPDELEYIFKHAVTQEIAYGSLLVSRRAHLHRHSAEAIESLFPDRIDELSSTLAMHFDHAGDAAKASAYHLRAARRAQAIFSHGEASSQYRDALRLATDETDAARRTRVEANIGLGDVLARDGRHGEAQDAYRAALGEIDEPLLRATARRKFGLTLVAQRLGREALESYAAAEADLGAPEQGWSTDHWHEWLELQLQRLWANYWLGDPAAMVAVAESARGQIDAHGTGPQKLLFVMGTILISFRREALNLSPATLATADAAFEIADQRDDPDQLTRANYLVGFCQLWGGKLQRAQQALEQALKLARHTGETEFIVMSLGYLAVVHRRRKDRGAVRRLAGESLALAEAASMPLYVALAKANLAWVASRELDWPATEADARRALAIWDGQPWPLNWLAAWPLITALVQAERLAESEGWLRLMLRPGQNRQPLEIERHVESAADLLASGKMEAARDALWVALSEARALGFA